MCRRTSVVTWLGALVVTSGGRAYHTVAVTNDATAFAAVTSVLAGSKLTYDVEIWKIE